MPTATSSRVLRKFRKLHKKIRGSDRVCSFVRFINAVEDYWTADPTFTEITAIDPQPVIKDQDKARFVSFGNEIQQESFFGGISEDQRIFIVLADSFVPRAPVETLSQRCEDFILARKGQTKGGILYGETIYVIERFFANPILGSVAARYYILGTAHKGVEGNVS